MSMELFKLMTSSQIAHVPHWSRAEQFSEHLHNAGTKWSKAVTATGARRVSAGAKVVVPVTR